MLFKKNLELLANWMLSLVGDSNGCSLDLDKAAADEADELADGVLLLFDRLARLLLFSSTLFENAARKLGE
jgi:hypothetical protein